ncbi:MAG: hypothetical protein C4294_17150 [Nitrospiraceae bacterium]
MSSSGQTTWQANPYGGGAPLPSSLLFSTLLYFRVDELAEISTSRSVLDDPHVQASLRRLRAMGLAVYASLESTNKAVIYVDVDSVLRYIVRKIDQSTNYPNKRITIDKENKVIKMEVWKNV